MDAFELRPLERQFKAGGVALTRPVVNLVRHSASAVKVIQRTVTAKEAPVQFDWRLGEVKVSDGQVAYQDPAFLPRALTVSLKSVNGVINGLSTDSNIFTEVKVSAQTERGEAVKVDWHGHQDRGLGVINSIAAFEAGADRLHGSALGIGERVGNAPMDQLLVNLQLMGLKEVLQVQNEELAAIELEGLS